MSRFSESSRQTGPLTGHRVYVWIIATSTLVLISLFLWPLSVKQFRSTTVFQLRYDPTSGLEKKSLNSLVIESLREQTDHGALAEIFSQMQGTLSSKVLNSLDPEHIRQAIQIQGRPGSSANSVEYRVSLVGNGSLDEIEFINSIVTRINSRLGHTLTEENNAVVVNGLTTDFGHFYDDRLNQVASQIQDVIQSLTTADNDIRIVSSDLQNLTTGPVSFSNGPMGRPTGSELERLKARRETLLAQPGKTPYHPEITDLQDKIEELTNEGPANSASGQFNASGRKVIGDTEVIKNRFVSDRQPVSASAAQSDPASILRQFEAPIGQIVDDIEMIDLSASSKSLANLQQSLDTREGTEVMVSRLNERALKQLKYDSPVVLNKIEMAQGSSPIGGAPSTAQFVWILLLAGTFGSVVALNYDPALKKRPFRSVDQIQRKLGLPVVGMLKSRSASQVSKPLNKLASARLVQCCEWTLLALAVLLILAALVNSQVAAAFIENPFHGITKTIWLLFPSQ